MMNDHPDYFCKLQAEQEEILKDKDPSVEGPRLTWGDTKRMVAAKNFFQEVQRYVSIAPVLARRTAEDVEYKGYVLPKGWKVLPLTSSIHHDPDLHPDPSRFNPERFNGVTLKPFSYVAFGHGNRLCPGMELAKLLTLIIIHHLTTSFVHKSAAPDRGVKYLSAFLMPVGGYPVSVRRRN
jgi:ent-kaurenoic acid hydroxylase